MTNPSFYHIISEAADNKKKLLGILLDPDKTSARDLTPYWNELNETADVFLIGGSLVDPEVFKKFIREIHPFTDKQLVIFPGKNDQISEMADALLLLSVISGRNPDLLIGQHVAAAGQLKKSGLEVIPTGYLLVESGALTTVQYISQSLPLPRNKPEIAVATAMAGELLGMKLIYLEAGSGAQNPVPAEMIRQVKGSIEIPLIVGGGLSQPDKIISAWEAGADMVIIGTAIEKDPAFLKTIRQLKTWK